MKGAPPGGGGFSPCSIKFWCMLEDCVEVRTRNILHQFMKGQTCFGMPKRCSTDFDPQWNKVGWSSFIFKHNLQACITSGEKLLIFVFEQPRGNYEGPTQFENSQYKNRTISITTSHTVIFTPWHLELFVDSNKVLVKSWFFCIQNFPCSIIFRCMSWCGERRTIRIDSL